MNQMKTDPNYQAPPVFLQRVSVALAHLKQQLQSHYEQAYPNLRQIIHLVLDQEEAKAWQLSNFPHLLFPDLVEAHLARINLQPAEVEHNEFQPFVNSSAFQPALALCA